MPVRFLRLAGWLMLPVMAEELDDAALMVSYRDGKVAAFETLYARHKGPVFRYFLRQGLPRDPADELAQEVWMKVINAKDSYEVRAKFTTWLYRLAHHCLVDHFRKTQRRFSDASPKSASSIDVATLPDDDRNNPESRAINQERAQNLRTAIAALPAEQREAFVLKQEAGLSLADVAHVTGVSSETAKSRLRYAFRKLRLVLQAEADNQ